jgi:hypothetical protein
MNFLSSETLNNIAFDSGYFGSALTSSQLLTGKSLDKSWMVSSVLTLLGFATYQIFVRQLIKTDSIAPKNLKMAADDIFKVGTMLLASRLFAQQSVHDSDWKKESLSTIAGFVAYDVATVHLVDTTKYSPKVKLVLDDILKFTTMKVVSRSLLGREFDAEFIYSSAAFLVGLLAYDIFVV